MKKILLTIVFDACLMMAKGQYIQTTPIQPPPASITHFGSLNVSGSFSSGSINTGLIFGSTIFSTDINNNGGKITTRSLVSGNLQLSPTTGDAIISMGGTRGALNLSSGGGMSNIRFNYDNGGGSGGISVYDGGVTNHADFAVNSSGNLFINSNGGKVGIGNNAPDYNLDIEGTLRVKNSGTTPNDYTNLRLQGASYTTGLEMNFFGNNNFYSDPALTYGGGAGSAAIINTNAKPLTFGTNNQGRMWIDADGKVGIGNNAPTHKLDIEGNTMRLKNSGTTPNDYTNLRLQGASYTTGLEMNFFGNNNFYSDPALTYGGGAGSAAIINTNAKPLTFGTNNQGRMWIDADGKVGVGTNSPQSTFHVNGASLLGSSGHEFYVSSGTTSYNSKAGIRNNGGNVTLNSKSDGTLYLNRDVTADVRIQSNSTDIATFLKNGYVGIGNSTPAHNLDIEGHARVKNSGTGLNDYTSFRVSGPNYTYGLTMFFFGNNNIISDPSWSYGGGAGSAAIVNVNAKPLTFGTNNLGRMWIDGTGNVGIGNSSPEYRLDVGGDTRIKDSGTTLNSYTSFRVQGPNYVNGLEIDFFGNNNINSDTSWSYGGGAGSAAIVNVNAKPLTLGTNNQGRMWIDGSGKVSIGTTNPGSYMLAVAGKVAAVGEVRLFGIGTTNFPDYVFDKDYQLPSLEETEKYVKENHHLPEVPSAAEIEKDGMSLNEMNVILLKKVEEITLLLIQQEKRIKAVQEENHSLKTRLDQIENKK
jgi:hypothetical protein